MTKMQRVIVLFADSTDESEDFLAALDIIRGPNYLPYPEDSTPTERKGPQPQMSREQADAMALTFLRRSIDGIHHGAQAIVPEVKP